MPRPGLPVLTSPHVAHLDDLIVEMYAEHFDDLIVEMYAE